MFFLTPTIAPYSLVPLNRSRHCTNYAFIISRVDYCNSVLFGASDRVHRKLQSAFNSAARLIADQITPIMRDDFTLLPARQRIAYKLAVIPVNCLHGLGP